MPEIPAEVIEIVIDFLAGTTKFLCPFAKRIETKFRSWLLQRIDIAVNPYDVEKVRLIYKAQTGGAQPFIKFQDVAIDDEVGALEPEADPHSISWR